MLIADTDTVTFLLEILIRSLPCSAVGYYEAHRCTTGSLFGTGIVPVHTTHSWCSRFVTTCRHNKVFHPSHVAKLCKGQAQRHLLSHVSLSWVTAAGIKELLCVSWTFRLWGTFLLPLESKSIWGPARSPVCSFLSVFSKTRGFGRLSEAWERQHHAKGWTRGGVRRILCPRGCWGVSESFQGRIFSA